VYYDLYELEPLEAEDRKNKSRRASSATRLENGVIDLNDKHPRIVSNAIVALKAFSQKYEISFFAQFGKQTWNMWLMYRRS
jgi:hypothetical protein